MQQTESNMTRRTIDIPADLNAKLVEKKRSDPSQASISHHIRKAIELYVQG